MTSSMEPKIELNLGQALRNAQWIALGVGAILLLVGFSGKEYAYLVAGCFFGIVARIAQAEHQHRESMVQTAVKPQV